MWCAGQGLCVRVEEAPIRTPEAPMLLHQLRAYFVDGWASLTGVRTCWQACDRFAPGVLDETHEQGPVGGSPSQRCSSPSGPSSWASSNTQGANRSHACQPVRISARLGPAVDAVPYAGAAVAFNGMP